MAWDVPAALHKELGGDPGPWHRHVKATWRASVTKTRDTQFPTNGPSAEYIKSPFTTDRHANVISYWGPVAQNPRAPSLTASTRANIPRRLQSRRGSAHDSLD